MSFMSITKQIHKHIRYRQIKFYFNLKSNYAQLKTGSLKSDSHKLRWVCLVSACKQSYFETPCYFSHNVHAHIETHTDRYNDALIHWMQLDSLRIDIPVQASSTGKI